MAAAMEDGAFGVSYALIYPPDAYTETDELVAVCRTVSQHDGLYITHMRSEAGRIFEALEEACTIGRQAACARRAGCARTARDLRLRSGRPGAHPRRQHHGAHAAWPVRPGSA